MASADSRSVDHDVAGPASQPDADEAAKHATVTNVKHMIAWRGRGSTGAIASRLGANDVAAIERLYADGESTGESPDFFGVDETDGVFFGVSKGEVDRGAGTHLVSREEGGRRIGNVYVRGIAADATGRVVVAVLHELAGIETIGLNVRADNDAAIRVYHSLGFVRHCDFREGLATPP